MNIIFMGTPTFAVPTLQALIAVMRAQEREPALSGVPCESQKTFTGAIKIVGVYSQPPRPAGRGQKLTKSPVHELAEQNNIPVFTPESLKTPEAQAEFAALNADVAVVAAYGLLLPKEILAAPKMGCINIHPSALPRWRGAAPLQRTLMAGDKTTEVCIMQMEAGLDTGPVILRETYTIPAGTNVGALHDTLAEIGAKLMVECVSKLPLPSTTQSADGVTYAAKITKADQKIEWQKPAAEIYHQILGLSPYPGAFFEHKGEQIKIFAARIVENTGKAGTVLSTSPLLIACGKNALELLELQRPGGKRLSAEEFLRGYALMSDGALD